MEIYKIYQTDKHKLIHRKLKKKRFLLLECEDHRYGGNCSNSCGYCLDGVPCNKATGLCPSGCASGYEGVYCNKSK